MLHAHSKQLPNTFDVSLFVFFMHSTGLIHSSIYEHFYINSSACSYRMLSIFITHNKWCFSQYTLYPFLSFPFFCGCVCVFYRSNKITCILCMDVKLVKHFTWIKQHQRLFSCCLPITRQNCFCLFASFQFI